MPHESDCLRRLTAILFLTILLFSFYGYQLVISCLQTGNDTAVEHRVDKREYRNDELVSIKTKLDLPYYTSSPDYERAYGSMTVNGKDYDYVMRRVLNDTLELLCLPNHAKTALKSASNDLARSGTDGQPATNKKIVLLKIGFPDFFQSIQTLEAQTATAKTTNYFLRNTSFSGTSYRVRQYHPPKPANCIS